MRIWSLHPQYFDAKGLIACWREALLAQKVLRGLTRGYKRHPQLSRFRACEKPVGAIASYLHGLCEEAQKRGYHFDERKIAKAKLNGQIVVTKGQLIYEWKHLLKKLKTRDPAKHAALKKIPLKNIQSHPLFGVVHGRIEIWEKT